MASQAEINTFHNTWNQTAGWAQQKGIKYNDYFPIYQQDTQRLMSGYPTMSQAERERAIEAASNVGQSTQVTPSTAPNAGNVIGNTITDARNIFTGLMPNHLVGGVLDTFKNTFDDVTGAHHLQGGNLGAKLGDALSSTVLSFVPGALDIGTVLSKEYGPGHNMGWRGTSGDPGFAALAGHPISSILDVLPLMKPLALARDTSEAGAAARVGMSVEQANKAGPIRTLKGYAFNTETNKIGPKDSGKIGAMTLGDRFHALTGGSILNANPAIADLVKGTEVTNTHYTTEERYYYNEFETTWEKMTEAEKEQMTQLWDPSQRSNLETRLKNPDLSPRVVQATQQLLDGPLRFQEEMSLAAADGPTRIINPRTGQTEVRATSGKNKAVYKASTAAKAATAKVLEKEPELQTMKAQTDMGDAMFKKSTQTLQQANETARQAHVDSSNFAFKPFQPEARTRMARAVIKKAQISSGVSHTAIAEKMFGTGGFIDQIIQKAQEGRYEDVAHLATAAMRRLDKWGIDSVDASADPAFQAVKAEVEKLGKSAQVVTHLQKKAEQEIYGKSAEWKGGKGHRDAMHLEEEKKLQETHRSQQRDLAEQKTQALTKLHRTWNLNRQHIRTNAADAKRAADAYVRDQTKNINDAFGIDKAKVQNRHLLAREAHAEWVRGRRAQGLPGPSDPTLAAQEGTRIAPGALGSREAILAGQDGVEAARLKALKEMEAQAPNKRAIDAKMQADLRDADQAEKMMTDKVQAQFAKDKTDLTTTQMKAEKDFRKSHVGKRSREGKTSQMFAEWAKAQKEFSDAVWKHPSDNKVDLFFNLFTKHLLANEKATKALATSEKALAREFNWGDKAIADARANPAIIRQIAELAIKGVFSDPIFKELDPAIVTEVRDSALNELDALGKQGIFPQYIPHVSETQLNADATGSYGIHLTVGKGVPKPDVMSSRTWGMDSSKYDLMAGLHRGTKQLLDRAAITDYAKKYLAPHVSNRTALRKTVLEYFPNEVANLRGQGLEDFVSARLKDWNLEKFNPSKYGYRDPAWGEEETYINSDLIRAVQKVTDKGSGLPTRNIYDKTTRLFRYSILGLSPRYTAHIVFGGTMLLALKEPLFFLHINEALKSMKTGQEPESLAVSPTNMGTTEYELSSAPKAIRAFQTAAGKRSMGMVFHEHIEKVQGIARGAEKPIHWLKAMADINLHFTSYVTHLQRSIAYTMGESRELAKGVYQDPATGRMVKMTPERAMAEGMHNAERVMGDLRMMSPFERQVARYAMPFYGWQKHILKYVLSFPADHPWRAMMLANMGEYDTLHNPGGLPSRYQFLFFLGQPDAQGNATVEDLRQINPLRDVANYATWQGIIGSLNPAITASFASIDPSIIYGGNQLYPNVTYDQFYGIEEAGPQGNLLTGATQIVPELGALKTAMGAASQRQGLSGLALAKNIGESLNFPWVPQHINLKQEAAKTAIAQYQVTKNLATNAWQTGDFSSIQDLGSVPDPRNADYETPVSELEQMYSELAKQYPGIPPDQTATPLPSAPL